MKRGPYIFISCVREDEARIQPLVQALKNEGFSVFWDRRIPTGENVRTYIGKALSDASCVMVVWSRHSIASDWITEEAAEGEKRGILVPVLLDAVEPLIGFGHIPLADLIDWQSEHPSPRFGQLVDNIKASLGGTQMVQVGETRFPKEDRETYKFWDGSQGPRVHRVPVMFDFPFKKQAQVVVSLRKIDVGDTICRLTISAENVRLTGFDLCFETWQNSKVYDAIASWIAVGE